MLFDLTCHESRAYQYLFSRLLVLYQSVLNTIYQLLFINLFCIYTDLKINGVNVSQTNVAPEHVGRWIGLVYVNIRRLQTKPNETRVKATLFGNPANGRS